ncbi:glycosyl hydrolase [Celerinatantimonas sp. YJH-8]|uniref:glycosyl hydrolase n=1 Tax=Celerinatantimonas sp. YJH-8 TaxID=3228714 RepID=UPI0038C327D4
MNHNKQERTPFLFCMLAVSVSLGIYQPTYASAETTVLERNFISPPNSARPRVWWHWMNGNITIDGIDKDLAWMHRMGIGGLHNFDASMPTPQIVPNRLIYMTPGWQKAFRHAVEKADHYGMEFGIASSAGWSETGGPWVKPKDGMKKVTWSKMVVKGGAPIAKKLPNYPTVTGPFQNVHAAALYSKDELKAKALSVSGDIGVYAVPLQYAAVTDTPDVLIAGHVVDSKALTDHSSQSTLSVPINDNNQAIFYLSYKQPTTLRSARLMIKDGLMPFSPERLNPAELQAKIDGKWQRVGMFPIMATPTTIGFNAVSAKQFRVIITPKSPASSADLLGGAKGAEILDLFPPAMTGSVSVEAFELSPEPQISEFQAKAGFTTVHNYYDLNNQFHEKGVQLTKVVDLSDKVAADGTIRWVPPKGHDWEIIHMGWSLTGKTNHPATPEATGLEVDKYDANAVRQYITTYLNKYKAVVGDKLMGKHGITTLVTDSVEIGASNWTPKMLQEFKKRRGYDAKPWLPALTGVLIGSAKASDQFLYDFRTTLGEMMAENHYGTIAKVAHQFNLKVYGESLEDQRPVLGDDIAMRHYTDVPMAAMWAYDQKKAPRPGLLGDIRGAASTAHFYGQNLVAAESMTSAFSPWAFAPSDLKHVIDLEFAYGVNRPVIHTSVHQPEDTKLPGLSLFIFGQYFNRHDTWAEMARPWVDYISRNAYLLQQGHYNADIGLFYGEETPVTTMFASGEPTDLPKHYAYDFLNKDMLAQLSAVKNGDRVEFVSPGGAHYRVIALYGTSQYMTLDTLKQLAKLAHQGGLIVGQKPIANPSMSGDHQQFGQLVDEIWSLSNVIDQSTHNLDDSLIKLGIAHDVNTNNHAFEQNKLLFVHRRLDKGDIYYLNNRTGSPMQEQVTFRVSGYQPMLWNPVDGSTHAVSYSEKAGQTKVDLQLKPEQSLYVVFKQPTQVTHRNVAVPKVLHHSEVTGPWQVTFEKGLKLPEPLVMQQLQPLQQSSNPDVKYFSGTTSYQTTLNVANVPDKGKSLWLDLGKVGDVAQVFVNGKKVATLWYAPKMVDVSRFVHQGANKLEVKVANLWVNRLIGDKQKGAKPLAWTSAPTFKADAPLRASGLIGPVQLLLKGM